MGDGYARTECRECGQPMPVPPVADRVRAFVRRIDEMANVTDGTEPGVSLDECRAVVEMLRSVGWSDG